MFEPKISSPDYEEARTKIYPLLGLEANEERRSCLVAIDGDLGAGKTHFANWLAWQFGAPVVYIDLYRDQVQFKTEEIERIIRLRLSQNRMVIFEGLYAFKILSKLNLNPKIKFKLCETIRQMKMLAMRWRAMLKIIRSFSKMCI